MLLAALPRLFCKLNKVFVMRLPFSEAVQKPLRNGAKVTGFFFCPFFFLRIIVFARERRTNELLLHLETTFPISMLCHSPGHPVST